MDEATWKAVQERAYQLWVEDGRPDGRAAAHWAQAEAEIVGPSESERLLQKSVDEAVPKPERLPEGFDENPISQHFADAATPGPGPTTFEGGNRVSQGRSGPAR